MIYEVGIFRLLELSLVRVLDRLQTLDICESKKSILAFMSSLKVKRFILGIDYLPEFMRHT